MQHNWNSSINILNKDILNAFGRSNEDYLRYLMC
jgi:hypothetical protein